jgi:hypothetical protein
LFVFLLICFAPAHCAPPARWCSLCVHRWSQPFYMCSGMLFCCFHIVFRCFPSACYVPGDLLDCPVSVVSVVVAVGKVSGLAMLICSYAHMLLWLCFLPCCSGLYAPVGHYQWFSLLVTSSLSCNGVNASMCITAPCPGCHSHCSKISFAVVTNTSVGVSPETFLLQLQGGA